MNDETWIYPIIATTLFVGFPVGLILAAFFPAKTPIRESIRAVASTLLGLGVLFIGWAASWPGPNEVTLAMMLSGLIVIAQSVCTLVRTCTSH